MQKRQKLINISLFIVVAVAAFFFGRSFPKSSAPGKAIESSVSGADKVQDIRLSGYQYINPLLECEQAEADFSELKPFKKEIVDLIEKEKNSANASFVSVYYRDMNNGPWIGINQDATFTPASLLKVPLMVAYYKIAENQPGILEEKIKVTSLAQMIPNEQFIQPSRHLEIGKTYSVSELIDNMIRYSDNDAAQLLISHVDLQTLIKVYKDFGLSLPTATEPETQVGVRQYAGFFRLLFNGSYLTQTDSEKAMETLLNVDFKNGLVAGVPDGISVAHKFGERITDNELTQLHDCGIVYYPKRPYLICVMTRGKDEQRLEQVIKDISALVYKQISLQIGP